jgi:RNA polymerase sigma factor (sigma-70 family)
MNVTPRFAIQGPWNEGALKAGPALGDWSPGGPSRAGRLDVTNDTTSDLQILIDRLRRGDQAARRELLLRAHGRLLKIAATVFQQDFPALHGRHELESVVSEVWMRLVGALEATQPETVEGFFGLVFLKVRQVLLDMAQRQRRVDARLNEPRGAEETDSPVDLDQPDTTHDPGQLALFTEFHEQVETLPEDQRRIFEMHYYGGFSQAEIAQILGLHRKQVSRLWLAATGRLALWLEEFAAPLR